MTEVMYCPDCGGVLGATEMTDAGRPCTCFTQSSSASVAAPPVVQEKAKVCRECGKDLTGKLRVKDSRGYLCPECNQKEKQEERGDRVRCRGCSHFIKKSMMTEYEGKLYCERCYAE